MYTSVNWLNRYLDPPADADEQAELLTRAGFPLEEREDVTLADGSVDVRQDYEMTSNRGDAVCHLGLAREIAAISGRTLVEPKVDLPGADTQASEFASVTNEEHALCPLYTGRVIRGAKVGPSPQWLQDHLIARGDIPRNNVVDATNYVNFELGQPTHVFDLARLKGGKIIIRRAKNGEPFLPLGEGEAEVKLTDTDLVIADAADPVALAGVKGGALSAVTEGATDLLLEAASFDPVTVRNTSRRLNIASDSSYRFERGVHPGQVEHASARLAELILQLAGGELCDGVLADGAPIPARRTASMRTERCRKILGVPVNDAEMMNALSILGFEPVHEGETISCTVPFNRLDIAREVDLIEEVGRMFGHDNIPVAEKLEIVVAPPQPTELARQAISGALTGMGFVETVTHSLVSDQAAALFLPPDLSVLRVDDDRAKANPVLRPSIIPSLMQVFARNCDGGVKDVKLFEQAATFAMMGEKHIEHVNLAMLMPYDAAARSLRPLRGIIERLVDIVFGHEQEMAIITEPALPWFEPFAAVKINGTVLGTYGVIKPEIAAKFGIEDPVCAAELGLPAYYEGYPPTAQARALPSFPSIERDVSVIVEESVTWAQLAAQVEGLSLQLLEAAQFVTTYRGKQIGTGRKSMTYRLRFRSPDRTLTHDEVDPQVEASMTAMKDAFGAEIRT